MTSDKLERNYMPGAEPFALAGDKAGVLLLHGFSGSCSEVRVLGERLHAAGFGVRAPALAGHGTSPGDLARITREDFLAAAEAAFCDAAARFERTYLVGLSMGGTLALHIAARYQVSALATISAPVFMGKLVSLTVPIALRWAPQRNVISNYAAWRGEVVGYRTTPLSSLGVFMAVLETVRRELPRVTAPLLVIQSAGDQTVPVANASFIAVHVASQVKDVRIYPRGRHILTLPPYLDTVSSDIIDFLQAQEAAYITRARAKTEGA